MRDRETELFGRVGSQDDSVFVLFINFFETIEKLHNNLLLFWVFFCTICSIQCGAMRSLGTKEKDFCMAGAKGAGI